MTASRPHILLIQSDQHRYDCLGTHRHPLLRTPHLDRLAAEGVDFSHAFTPIPVCVPARNCLAYGQWSVHHLSIANWNTEAPRPARAGLRAFSEVLREAGYYLGHVGKWQVHPERGPEATTRRPRKLLRGHGRTFTEAGPPPARAARNRGPAGVTVTEIAVALAVVATIAIVAVPALARARLNSVLSFNSTFSSCEKAFAAQNNNRKTSPA